MNPHHKELLELIRKHAGKATKAISWVLRSMVRHYREEVEEFIENNKETLPRIAIRETLAKLKTGTKTKRK